MKCRSGFVSNSSSSSFICQTKLSLDVIKEKLQKILALHNDLSESDLPFNSVFSDPFIAGDDYVNNGWADYYPEVLEAKGKTIIESVYDNSIPYELFDLIETTFDGRRLHFG